MASVGCVGGPARKPRAPGFPAGMASHRGKSQVGRRTCWGSQRLIFPLPYSLITQVGNMFCGGKQLPEVVQSHRNILNTKSLLRFQKSLKKAAGRPGQCGTSDFQLSTKEAHSHAGSESFQKAILINTKIFMSFICQWRMQLILNILSQVTSCRNQHDQMLRGTAPTLVLRTECCHIREMGS